MRNNEKIFVQIASYRDPELKKTLSDLFEKAKNPNNLKVCIAWQHSDDDEWDNLDEFRLDKRIEIIDIDYKFSKGACWARNLIQKRYNGEKYTLQLDSHHRFVENWDEKCINTLKDLQQSGSQKPLLTSYISSYDPKNDPDGRVMTPWGMSFHKFTPEGIVFFLPYHMNSSITKPIKARYFSAHFAFTLGIHCIEVPHNPEYYFHGEEITLAVRSYTNGYDLYHPAEIIAWHEYTREGRTKHWDDDEKWYLKNVNTHIQVRKLLGVDEDPTNDERIYNLGSARTLKEYEEYSGINFKTRTVTRDCESNKEPV